MPSLGSTARNFSRVYLLYTLLWIVRSAYADGSRKIAPRGDIEPPVSLSATRSSCTTLCTRALNILPGPCGYQYCGQAA